MYERCLNEAERMLAVSREVVLPIKEVWRQLATEGKRRAFEVPSLTDFDALLEGDKRFEIISAQTDPDEIEALLSEDGEEVDSNLGTLGFYPEDRVKLRRIKLPSHASTGASESKENEDDEELVPFNVRGLSATKPVGRVESKKTLPKKALTKSTPHAKSSSTTTAKKKAKKTSRPRKAVRRPSRKS